MNKKCRKGGLVTTIKEQKGEQKVVRQGEFKEMRPGFPVEVTLVTFQLGIMV